MTNGMIDIREFHWMMDMLESIEVGLVVLDLDYRIVVWNGFMENHSGITASRARGDNLFERFPELPAAWLKRKVESVVLLKTRAFTSWEQRPYLFRFRNYRPITGTEAFMYQNLTISPLVSTDGTVSHVCLIIYDVTDTAAGRKALERANAQLEKLSQTDRLTGLLNRGAWETLLVNEFERFRRYRHHCALVMFDIDHFKRVNDTWGHQAGDEVIRTTSRILLQNLRQTDIGGRYGGEEFGVILPETDARGAQIFCERVRKNIADMTVSTHVGDINYTISLGISIVDDTQSDYTQWLEQSDKALYAAKEGGRNQVRIFGKDMGPD